MGISVGVIFFLLLNSLDIQRGGLVNISLETVKYLCKSLRSQFEINEGCSARTMTNLFHLPAQQEEAAIPTKGNPSHVFLFLSFPKASEKFTQILIFKYPVLYFLLIPRIFFFLNQEKREWAKWLGNSIFQMELQNSSQQVWGTLLFVVMSIPESFSRLFSQQNYEII